MQLRVSPEVNTIMGKALNASVHEGQLFVGVEHVFVALLDDPRALPTRMREQYLNVLYAVAREVKRASWKGVAAFASPEVFHTPRCVDVISSANKLAERFGRGIAQPSHLLMAILGNAHSAPSRAMDRLNLERGQFLALLRSELCNAAAGMRTRPPEKREQEPGIAAPPHAGEAALETREERAVEHEPLPKEALLTRDMTEAAMRGQLEPAIGRDKEIFQIMQVLTRRTKNNVILVGDAGVGKTQVVEGLVLNMARGAKMPGAPNFRFLELNLAALMVGTQYRGAFEEKVLALLEQLKQSEDLVLFIDEVHLIMGAGSTDGDSMDLANLLKPALARGEIRCIGATTLQEYRKFVEKDPAIERRFQMVRLEELSPEATLDVLRHLRPLLEKHHSVRISNRAIQAAVSLTQRYMPNRRLPDKAIDMLDQACARFRMKLMAMKTNPKLLSQTVMPTAEESVTPHDIRKVVSQATGIPVGEITAEDRIHLTDLERQIRSQLIGQDEAVSRAVSAVKKSRMGLADPNRPEAVMLFLGPSGVGKTQLAKLLARYLFGSRNHLITFDMSGYIEEHSVARLIGAPPGYVGSEEEGQLTGAVRNMPFSILLFDEIEKAHPRIFDIFLPIFEEGRLKDSRGNVISFKNCIIILTSNIGANLLSRSVGDAQGGGLMDELRQHFRPEFINRIDEIIPFCPLLAEDVTSILRLEVGTLRERLKERRLGIRMYQKAYEHLAALSYNPEFGAREVRRTVDRMIATPISEMMLEGVFQPGDIIDVLVEDQRLVFRKGQPQDERQEA